MFVHCPLQVVRKTHELTKNVYTTTKKKTLFPKEGSACVTKVFEQAYKDIAPLSLYGKEIGGSKKAGEGHGLPPHPSPPAGKLPNPPIGRIPAAASVHQSSSMSGTPHSSHRGATNTASGRPPTPPPATGLAEILVSALGMK